MIVAVGAVCFGIGFLVGWATLGWLVVIGFAAQEHEKKMREGNESE